MKANEWFYGPSGFGRSPANLPVTRRFSNAPGCYCSSLVDSTCDFCRGIRILAIIRTDKHSQAITRMTFADGVNDLASIMPASIYNSRLEVAADLVLKGHIETLGYLYEISAS